MDSIATAFSQTEAELAREITDGVTQQMPAEKAKAVAELARTGRELQEHGSDRVEGRGQMVGSIPARIYMRWHQMLPGCWKDKQFVDEFLRDNPQCCGVGYKPKQHTLRHGFQMGASFYQQNKAKVS
tara:strand:- start:5448 stop:5828 length:381 start_codon:yes stop_codon:yes gene_type:complete